jgi:uncharacterized protein YlbG (UPF0298 family)
MNITIALYQSYNDLKRFGDEIWVRGSAKFSTTYVNEMALGIVETAIKMLYPRLLCVFE